MPCLSFTAAAPRQNQRICPWMLLWRRAAERPLPLPGAGEGGGPRVQPGAGPLDVPPPGAGAAAPSPTSSTVCASCAARRRRGPGHPQRVHAHARQGGSRPRRAQPRWQSARGALFAPGSYSSAVIPRRSGLAAGGPLRAPACAWQADSPQAYNSLQPIIDQNNIIHQNK